MTPKGQRARLSVILANCGAGWQAGLAWADPWTPKNCVLTVYKDFEKLKTWREAMGRRIMVAKQRNHRQVEGSAERAGSGEFPLRHAALVRILRGG